MRQRLFERWNWEFDYGVGPIPEDEPLPSEYAIAYYDRLDRLYRVEVRRRAGVRGVDEDQSEVEVFVYDYFCDVKGRILQKRAYGEQGEVDLIVDFEYDLESNQVIETAWWPANGTCKSIKRPLSDLR
jgi:glycosylphosphatidylinositol transamidase (GPIT) subunit GPI8